MLVLSATGSIAIACAKPVIRSSVSPEFMDGLHTRYLRYMADQMDMELEIYPIPFARRLVSLENGEIDLMVGVKGSYPENGFVYLRPSYETLRNTYFVRADELHLLTEPSQINNLTLAITIDDQALMDKAYDKVGGIVPVTSLEQKIMMLDYGRVDAFVHFESSAMLKIKQLGLERKMMPALVQPGKSRDYYFALSIGSPLFEHKSEFERTIAQGVQRGDFAAIRFEYEQEHELKLMQQQTNKPPVEQ